MLINVILAHHVGIGIVPEKLQIRICWSVFESFAISQRYYVKHKGVIRCKNKIFGAPQVVRSGPKMKDLPPLTLSRVLRTSIWKSIGAVVAGELFGNVGVARSVLRVNCDQNRCDDETKNWSSHFCLLWSIRTTIAIQWSKIAHIFIRTFLQESTCLRKPDLPFLEQTPDFVL
jgi:hypothetical protein